MATGVPASRMRRAMVAAFLVVGLTTLVALPGQVERADDQVPAAATAHAARFGENAATCAPPSDSGPPRRLDPSLWLWPTSDTPEAAGAEASALELSMSYPADRRAAAARRQEDGDEERLDPHATATSSTAATFQRWNERYHRRIGATMRGSSSLDTWHRNRHRRSTRKGHALEDCDAGATARSNAPPPPRRNPHLHMYFTVDCTYHSLWQALALERSWETVGQGGYLTRIVSGCEKNPKKQQYLAASVIRSPHFGVFFAPDYSTLPGAQREYYAPYNRPSAIAHWLWHTVLTVDSSGTNHHDRPREKSRQAPLGNDSSLSAPRIYVNLDPDMIFIAPLDIADAFANAQDDAAPRGVLVREGQPAAQRYAYMAFDLDNVRCGERGCPRFKQEQGGGAVTQAGNQSPPARHVRGMPDERVPPDGESFAVGPPWAWHIDDLVWVVPWWQRLTPAVKRFLDREDRQRVQRGQPTAGWIAEMVAYSVAMKFLGLRHRVVRDWMVDHVDQDESAWREFGAHAPNRTAVDDAEDDRLASLGLWRTTSGRQRDAHAANLTDIAWAVARHVWLGDAAAPATDRRSGLPQPLPASLMSVIWPLETAATAGSAPTPGHRLVSATPFSVALLRDEPDALARTLRRLLTVPLLPSRAKIIHYCFTWEVGVASMTDDEKYERGQLANGAASKSNLEQEDADSLLRHEEQQRAPALHYFHFSKYRVPTDWPGGKTPHSQNFVSCGCPLLQELPLLVDPGGVYSPTTTEHFVANYLYRALVRWRRKTVARPLVGVDAAQLHSSLQTQLRLLPSRLREWGRWVWMAQQAVPRINDAMRQWRARICSSRQEPPGAPRASVTRTDLQLRLRTTHPAFYISRFVIDDIPGNESAAIQHT